MPTIGSIVHVLDALAPAALAESWDNVGLLVGDAGAEARTVLVALDATAEVLDQAGACGAELLLTHHPLIFKPISRLTEDRGATSLAMRLVREGRGLIACHTNLDSAPGGLNAHVARLLGLRDPRPLLPTEARPLLKLVVYVPATHLDAVRAAIGDAGAGHIGNYDQCAFAAPGTGTFRAGAGAKPFVGTVGELERVEEVRLETVVPRPICGAVVAAMRKAHPYEEVAYDLLPLENPWVGAGLGRVGRLAEPTTVAGFLARVRTVLHTDRIGVVGDPDAPVRTVALCTGSGGDFAIRARGAGADLYLTGEVKHSQALLARQQGLALLDAGHFATERPAVPLMADYLRERLPGLTAVEADERDPMG
jgi:dinuclear metal center YbgI/SA1388 family protein